MIKPYGFLIALGLLALYLYAQKRAPLYKLKSQEVEPTLLLSVIFALIGARLYHVFSSFSYYQDSPLKVFLIWEGGLGIFGAILGGIAGLFLYSKLKHLNSLNLLNLMTPPLLLAQAIGRIGNFFNHEGFGPPTNLPWKVFIPVADRPPQFVSNSYFHPTFFYESFLCFVTFLVFLLLPPKFQKTHGFSYFLVSYGLIRFFTEFYRWDTARLSFLRLGSVLTLAMVGTGLIVLKKRFS